MYKFLCLIYFCICAFAFYFMWKKASANAQDQSCRNLRDISIEFLFQSFSLNNCKHIRISIIIPIILINEMLYCLNI